MIATVSLSPAHQGCRITHSIDETLRVAAEAGYARLEDLLRRRPEAAEAYILEQGYWLTWRRFRSEYGHDAVSRFLIWVRKDMGL